MRAEHNDFALLVGAWNLRDGVPGSRIAVQKPVSDVDLELDGNFALEQAGDASEVLRRQNDPGNAFGLARFPGAALLHAKRAAIVGSFREDGGNLLFGEELASGLRAARGASGIPRD